MKQNPRVMELYAKVPPPIRLAPEDLIPEDEVPKAIERAQELKGKYVNMLTY
jgi:hypothetical protein